MKIPRGVELRKELLWIRQFVPSTATQWITCSVTSTEASLVPGTARRIDVCKNGFFDSTSGK